MKTTPVEQRNFLRKLREAGSRQTDIQETSIIQVNAASSYLDSLPPRRKGAFHMFLDARRLRQINLSKPVLLLEDSKA